MFNFPGIDTIKVVLDEGAFMPTRAHEDDAGLDLYSPEDAVVPAGKSYIFDTGVHVELPVLYLQTELFLAKFRTVGSITSKSGLFHNHDILTDGTIDVGYSGRISVKLLNVGDKDYVIKRGNKIAQLVIGVIITPVPVSVDKLKETERGDNGFGSTGK